MSDTSRSEASRGTRTPATTRDATEGECRHRRRMLRICERLKSLDTGRDGTTRLKLGVDTNPQQRSSRRERLSNGLSRLHPLLPRQKK